MRGAATISSLPSNLEGGRHDDANHLQRPGWCVGSAGLWHGGPTEPEPADRLSGSTTSAHIDFHFATGDNVDAPRQEAFHEWVVQQLGVTMPSRLQYNKYRDRSHMQRVTGQLTNGWADPPAFATHSIWNFDPHEAVHVYSALIGRPSDFFNEGIAVALSFDPLGGRFTSLWNATPINDIARGLLRNGTMPALASITETESFRRLSEQTSYPASGSFVSFMIADRGMTATQTFFRISTRQDTQATIEARFSDAFGLTLGQAEARWRAFLQ
jgi:hypothetical protein